MKQCTKCGQPKPLSEFVKRGSVTRGICKECYNLSKRKTPVKQKPRPGYKYCADCGEEKQISEFNVRLSAGKERIYSYCKQCERVRNNSRYSHKCATCGKEYTSGKKTSGNCSECRNAELGKMGREALAKWVSVPEHNPWYGKHRYGETNPNYNPSKTEDEREIGRIIPGYKEWVRRVYERDGYTCQCCGDSRGGNLNAHHLDGYNWCKDKRTEVENGVTLCENCHQKFHKLYGFKDNTREQFYKFKKQIATM
jgi:hypothetical protein